MAVHVGCILVGAVAGLVLVAGAAMVVSECFDARLIGSP